jgi:hypothetical protein
LCDIAQPILGDTTQHLGGHVIEYIVDNLLVVWIIKWDSLEGVFQHAHHALILHHISDRVFDRRLPALRECFDQVIDIALRGDPELVFEVDPISLPIFLKVVTRIWCDERLVA